MHALDYSVEGVRRLIGDSAADALDRDDAYPASRILRADDGPLATVVRAFMLNEAVERDALGRAFGTAWDDAHPSWSQLVTAAGSQARSRVELTPCAVDDVDWLIASDWSSRRTGAPTASDHVLGVGGASTMLAQCTVRPDVDSALDVGTGCGIQAFHLSTHSRRVVATDVSARCVEFAAFNASLNRIDLELREGSLFEPVMAERFELIVSNPPFVIGSPADGQHDYRDFGGVGDTVCADLVAGAADRLTVGGWCQLLANWEIVDGSDWALNPRTWLESSGLDAWVIQRDVQDPVEYVTTWLRDSGDDRDPAYPAIYDEWLGTLESRGVLGVGFGVITLRNSRATPPVRRFQHAGQPWQQPVAPDIVRWFEVQDLLRRTPAGVLTEQLRVASDVVLEQHGLGDSPVLMVRRTTGMSWSGPIDPFGAQVLMGLDGQRPAAEAVLAAAAEFQIEPESALSQAIPVLGQLAEEGFVRRESGQ